MTSKKLYVGNLPFSSAEEQLRELFGQCGAVESVSLITDKYSGKSKGFGFVEMSSLDEAERAINQFNGYDLDGRKISVSEARPREDRPRTGGGGFGGGNRFGGGNGGSRNDGGSRGGYGGGSDYRN